jgi:uroporphyrinogen decarboxylase
MNSLQRVLATASGQPVDRPAYTLTLSLYGARLIGCPLNQYYTQASAYVEGQCAVREIFAPDLIFSPFVLTALAEAFGGEVIYFEQQAPNLARPGALSAAAAAKLPIPDLDTHPRLLFMREAVRSLATRYRGEVPIVGVVLAPFDLPPLLMGIDLWLETLLEDEPAARAVLDLCTAFFIRWANALLQDGATFLAFPAVFCNPAIVPWRVIDQIALPVLRGALSEVQGPLVMHHGGMRLAPYLSRYLNLPNVAAFVIDGHDALAEARATLGAAPLLLGNLDGPTLDRHTPQALQARCRQILTDRVADPRFIFATSGPDVGWTTPPELIQTVCQTVQEFRFPA